MPPQNQNPPLPNNQDRYDFFLNPPAAPKRIILNPFKGDASLRKRLMVVAVGLIALIIAIILVSSLFGGGINTTQFIAVAQDQNELVRVATEANGQAAEQTTQNLAQSVQLSLTSAQQQLLAYLVNNGKKIGTAQLEATKDVKTDQALTAAEAASNFDSVFVGVMQTRLQSYAQDINTAYPSAGPRGKALLKSEYAGAQLLLSQAKAVASSLSSQ